MSPKIDVIVQFSLGGVATVTVGGEAIRRRMDRRVDRTTLSEEGFSWTSNAAFGGCIDSGLLSTHWTEVDLKPCKLGGQYSGDVEDYCEAWQKGLWSAWVEWRSQRWRIDDSEVCARPTTVTDKLPRISGQDSGARRTSAEGRKGEEGNRE